MAANVLISEKRNLPRRELIYYLKIHDLKHHVELGRLVDIHSNGLLVIGHKCLNVSENYHLSVELPKVLSEQGFAPIEVNAKCVWVHPSQARPFNESGLMFTETSGEATKTIQLLIDLFALPDVTLKA
jgi:hypothetical protein